ncbi:hypothetical protein CC78DRAFT_602885 [Lojkania enalia]|uniref:Glycosyl transferase CAP10 domain-containing protein n=1 Tax=Lojkania enalia TaxID=147567 RepID=A0A9P4KCS7_9PLEO|nr:hypothetical protein CC78DRAFT_602885 [Didymosphaeria enalia]
MDRKWLLYPCGVVTGTCYLASTVDKSFAFDRPVHSAAAVLFLSGLAFVASYFLASSSRQPHRKDQYLLIPLDESGRAVSREPSPAGQRTSIFQARLLDIKTRVALAVLLLVAVCGRVGVFWRVAKDIECAGPTPLAFIPLVLALYNVGYHLKYSNPAPRLAADLPPTAPLDLLPNLAFRGPTRYVLPSFLLSISSFLATWRASTLRSTYICPIISSTASKIHRLQFFGFVLDCIIVLVLYTLVNEYLAKTDTSSPEPGDSTGNALWLASAFIASSVVLAVVGLIVYASMPEHRQWLLEFPSEYTHSLLQLCFTIPCTIVCFLFTVSAPQPPCYAPPLTRQIRMYGVMSAVLMIGFTSAFTGVIRTLRAGVSHSFPPKPTTSLTLCLILLTIALILFLITDASAEGRALPKIHMRLGRYQALLFLLLLFVLSMTRYGYYASSYGPSTPGHPIATLIETADDQFEQWARQAKRSRNLPEAVKHYQERYLRDPPPGFDIWYDFATSRSSDIIDDFDNIDEDLAPFSSLSAAELRGRTGKILADDNSVGGIRVRNGTAESLGKIPFNRTWMKNDILAVIEKFVQYLPDMDLAFNFNDECMVAVPFEDMQNAYEQRQVYPDPKTTKPTVDFSANRASSWWDITEVPMTDSYFRPTGFSPTYQSHGSVACPPDSRARQERHWDTGALCASCAAPHSMGIFISNWTLSASPCHQPDLANLHGFHLSPSALDGTHALIPVFSMGRAPGYADIRYPPAFNYLDKASYAFDEKHPDPPFSKKEKTLFWRGSTTEGMSPGTGAWKGMLRQRLVHLVNNESHPQAILLPGGKKSFAYTMEDPASIKDQLGVKLDARFSGASINHCAKPDCEIQTLEFGLASGIDFKGHWRFKYLFDADGQGFSGRFIPFLRSNSVVFKSALYREWYEGRLIAWKHFVPVDLRLHDLWSSVAFFGGYGEGEDGKWTMKAKEKEAEKIARESKVWSEKVLRKEDMEIYMFRLLLEWGRLTDERRVELGFRLGPDTKGGKGNRKTAGRYVEERAEL